MPSKPRPPNAAASLRYAKRDMRIDRAMAMLIDAEDPKAPHEVAKSLVKSDRISIRMAWNDVSEAWRRAAAMKAVDRQTLFAQADMAWGRREAIADKRGDTQAANFALDRWTKLHGLYAPKKVELGGSVSIGLQIRGIMGILDADGVAALGVVMEQIERARSAGLLTEAIDVGEEPADPDAEDADDDTEEAQVPARPPAKRR